MKIMLQWEIHPDQRQDVFAAFAAMDLDAYKAQAGPNVTTLARWHDVGNGRGVAVFETTDPTALSEVLMKWNSAVDFEMSLVHDDDEAHALIRNHLASDG
jgi:hypothetical protein